MSEDEFDNIPDPFAGMTDAEWSTLLGPTNPHSPTHNQSHHPPHPQASPSGSTASTDYGNDISIDLDTLVELDRIEASVLQIPGGSSSSAHGSGPRTSTTHHHHRLSKRDSIATESHYFLDGHLITGSVSTINTVVGGQNQRDRSLKKPRTRILDALKINQDDVVEDEKLRGIFESYEEELTCPICCDLYVATHIGNPCGHSVCGDCGWQWVKKNRANQCPFCRADLIQSAPLIPNIAMDNLIEKHIEHLGFAGDSSWKPQGSKFRERALRKERWKASSDVRKKVKQTRKAEIHPIVIEESSLEQILGDGNGSYVIEPMMPRLRSLRARRALRQ